MEKEKAKTREGLMAEIESLREDLAECEESRDYGSMPYLTSLLVKHEKELDELNSK